MSPKFIIFAPEFHLSPAPVNEEDEGGFFSNAQTAGAKPPVNAAFGEKSGKIDKPTDRYFPLESKL